MTRCCFVKSYESTGDGFFEQTAVSNVAYFNFD